MDKPLLDVFIVIISIAAIIFGSIWLVDSTVRVARKLKIPELVIGLTIMAMATSAPEFMVTVMNALRGIGDISVGNIVGSNIFNLGFILGGTAILHSLKTDPKVTYRDGGFLLFGTLLLLWFLVFDHSLDRYEGYILITLLLIYLVYLFWKKEAPEPEAETGDMRFYDPLLMLLGIVMVLAGAHYMVGSARNLAVVMGVSDWVIAATIVAAGTSAPEFAISLVAAIRGRYGLSIGNLIGSDMFNIFGVLGVAAILNKDLPIDPKSTFSLFLLFAMVFLVLVFMRSGWKISRKEGIILVSIGLIRWIISFAGIDINIF